jgi:hypothetical protein
MWRLNTLSDTFILTDLTIHFNQYKHSYNYWHPGHYLSSCFYLKQHFKDCTLPLTTGKNPTKLGPINRADPYLQTQNQNKAGYINKKKRTLWLWSAGELCQPSDRHLLGIEGVAWSAQRIPPVVSLGFLDHSHYYFFQVAPQLSSGGWVDPVPDPLLLRKSWSARNRTQDLWICSQKLTTRLQRRSDI